MAARTDLQILLTADDQASKVLAQAGTNAETTGSKMSKAWNGASAAMGALAGVASGVLVGALSKAANAAAEDEANVVKLQTAIESSGASWDDNAAKIEARIKKGQELAFTDDQVRDSIAKLTTSTGDVNKALDMQNLVMDIARGRHIDLGAATDIAQKAALGQFGALKKLGIVLAEGSTATEALGELQKRYANQAENYGTTASAAIFKVKDGVDEWSESIGKSLGPAQQYIALLPGITGGMVQVGTAVGGLTPLILKLTAANSASIAAWQASAASALATVAPFLLVAATAALVVVAILQVKETVDVVREHWDTFVYALTTGRLNDIPVFGFLFSKIQQLIGLVNGAVGAWNTLTSLIGGSAAPTIPTPPAATYTPPSPAYPAPAPGGGSYFGPKAYATGTDYVQRTGPAIVHEGERITPAGENRGGAIDYDRLASAIASALSRVSLSVGVDDIHGALLRKQSRNGTLALS